jgi:hypothetical protein
VAERSKAAVLKDGSARESDFNGFTALLGAV